MEQNEENKHKTVEEMSKQLETIASRVKIIEQIVSTLSEDLDIHVMELREQIEVVNSDLSDFIEEIYTGA